MGLSRTRRRVAGAVAGTVLAASLGASLTACSDTQSATPPGEVVPGRASLEIIGDYGFVLIPTGRIDVVVGEPSTDDVSRDDAADDQTHETPDAGSWIPVHVDHDPFGAMAVPVRLMGGSPQPAQVALVVDGTTISLGAPYRVVGEEGTAESGLDNVWVAIDERPDEVESIQVAVTYDGLTQTLVPKNGAREAGVATSLYEQPTEPVDVACRPDGFDKPRVTVDASCTVAPVQRSPYVPGAGWAEEGRTWLVVGAAVSIDRVLLGRRSYGVESIEPSMTVGGNGPLPPSDHFGEVRQDPDRAAATWVFDVPDTGAVRAVLRLEVRLDDRAQPVTTEQAVELG